MTISGWSKRVFSFSEYHFLMDNILPDYNLFYFYNPCKEIILNKVIQNIISSFSINPRWGMIVYQNNIIEAY